MQTRDGDALGARDNSKDRTPFTFSGCMAKLKSRIPRSKRNLPGHIVLEDGTSPNFHGRLITLHNPTKNAHSGFPTNYVSTTHYTWYSFIPKNLFEQFRRVANFYFLVCAVLSLLPLSPYEPYTSIMPLVFVLGVSAIREAFEDYGRFKQDVVTNNRKALVLRGKEFAEVPWANVLVGDILKVKIDSMIPSDLVLLASSDESGLAYVETANLDGETNLKAKSGLSLTQRCTNEADLLALRAEILAEPPTTELYKFQGQLIMDGTPTAIVANNLILRGCELRNTNYIFGVAVYTGGETRIQMNASSPVPKRSRIEAAMEIEIFRILSLQLILCFIAAVIFGVLRQEDQSGQWFTARRKNIASEACETFVTWFLLLSVMLPISLYVTLELVKVIQGYHMSWDHGMYYEPLKKGCQVRSVSLNEDLGQISHVFSDKTGTLTRNEMIFLKGSVMGKPYDHLDNYGAIRAVFMDTLQATADPEERNTLHMYLLNLSLCHTVIPEAIVDPKTNDKRYKYLSPSPDEEALVVAAAVNGYVLTQRTSSTLTICVSMPRTSTASGSNSACPIPFNEPQTYTIIRELEFTSDRKRMSIVLRCPDGRLLLLSKGADTEILKRLKLSSLELIQATKQNLISFASDGLRTLVLGYRWLEEDWFNEWNAQYEAASIANDRDKLVEEVSDRGEQELELCGATAIEDRLQEGVPETLTRMRLAGVRVWVLTGDKQETAINIGHSSGLLISGMHIFVLNGITEDELLANDIEAKQALGRDELDLEKKARRERQAKTHTATGFENALAHIAQEGGDQQGTRRGSHGLGYALVMDSETLKWALDSQLPPILRPKLLELSELCRSVLLCRCTPLQKALAVELVKFSGRGRGGLSPVTLAIGDGANDVGMIQAAHIGVGISGKEGMQAVQASDYAFCQFAYLQRLMFLHGRWNYRRISLLVVYSFYKNIALVITQFWFGFQSQFTGQTLYDGLAGNIYNVFFTSGILVTAVLDKDASERVIMAHPELYRSGMLNERFTSRIFWTWWVEGLWDSCLIYFFCIYMLGSLVHDPTGRDFSLDGNGFVVYSAAVIVVNFRLALANNQWTWINWFFLWGSIGIWYLFGMLYSSEAGYLLTYTMYWVYFHVMTVPHFWLSPFLLGIVCNLPIFIKMFTQREMKKSLKQKLKEAEKRGAELPGERAMRELHAKQGHGHMLSASNKQASVIVNVGRKNRRSSHMGFAMDGEVKAWVSLPFVKAKRAASRTARALSKRVSLKVGATSSTQPPHLETTLEDDQRNPSNPDNNRPPVYRPFHGTASSSTTTPDKSTSHEAFL